MNRREQEILTALYYNQKGLTTAQTTAWCLSQVGADLPNNTSIVSKLIFDLRRKNYITYFDSTSVGKMYQLTEQGKQLIEEVLADELDNIKADKNKQEEPTIEDKQQDYLQIDKKGEYAAIAQLITEHKALKAICNINKMTEKLEILNQLISSPFIDETVTAYLQEIADDLQGVTSITDREFCHGDYTID